MLGEVINALGILLGGAIGLLVGRKMNEGVQTGLSKALSLSVLVVGLNGVISNMFTVEGGKPQSAGELLLVCSLAIGTLAGEALRLEERITAFSRRIEGRFRMSGFTAGFVSASTLFCVGAMGVVGSLSAGLTGDISILVTKSLMDMAFSVVLAGSLGSGVLASAVPVFLYQGAICLLAGQLRSVLVGELLRDISVTGFALIICIGLNYAADAKIRVANMLPALLVPPLWHVIRGILPL